MVEIQETIERLSRGFVAADIMKPNDELICGTSVDHAKRLLEEHEQYDIIPICEGNRIASFLNRGSPQKQESIQIQHTISSETPILDLLDSLTEENFVFVVGQRRIIGFVHFSDLNDPIVKIPLFVLLEGLERVMTNLIREIVNDGNLDKVIKDPKRLNVLRKKMASLIKKNAEREWSTMFYTKEILEAAVYFEKASIKQKDIDDIANVRDRVCHAASKKELVEDHSDIRRLQKVKSLCLSFLVPDLMTTDINDYSLTR